MATTTTTTTAARPAGAAETTDAAAVTVAQVYGFADLVRRLAAARCDQDGDRLLRQDLADPLFAFAELLPEPSDEDGDAYLAAVGAGELPDWGMDDQPLTKTSAKRPARVRVRLAAEQADTREAR